MEHGTWIDDRWPIPRSTTAYLSSREDTDVVSNQINRSAVLFKSNWNSHDLYLAWTSLCRVIWRYIIRHPKNKLYSRKCNCECNYNNLALRITSQCHILPGGLLWRSNKRFSWYWIRIELCRHECNSSLCVIVCEWSFIVFGNVRRARSDTSTPIIFLDCRLRCYRGM